MKMQADAAEIAEVHTTALMMDGNTDMPDLSKAMVNGD